MPFGTGARLHRTLPDVSTPHVPEDIARLSMAEMPDGPSGQVLTGRGIGVEPGYAPPPGAEIVRKTVDEVVSNSTTLQNDDELFFPIGAGETWQITFYVRGASPTAADWQMRVTPPSEAIGECLLFSHFTRAGVSIGSVMLAGSRGHRELILLQIMVTNGGISGNVQLQWAQQAANASNTTVFANSCIIAQRIA